MVAGENAALLDPGGPRLRLGKRTLVFDIELLHIDPVVDPPTPPTRSSDRRAAEAARRRLPDAAARTGTERPKPMSTVSIHYTGWAGNEVFDDSWRAANR